MSERTEFTVLRRWEDVEGHEKDSYGDWIWPRPPEYVESRVEGELREKVLRRVGREVADGIEVRIIEGETEGGYSEYTVEVEFEIEVWVHDGRQRQKVWGDDYNLSSESALASFLRWVDGAVR